ATGEWEMALDCVDNMEWEIMHLGFVSNGNARFYTRMQTPNFSHSVRMVSEKFGEAALVRYLPALEREYQHHMAGQAELPEFVEGEAQAAKCVIRMPDGSILNRYWDEGEGPRLESYKEDVEMGALVVKGLTGAVREQRLRKFYKDVRAGAAWSWDYSSVMFEDGANFETINATDLASLQLNCLMTDSEETLAAAYSAKAKVADPLEAVWCEEKAAQYREMAESRKAAIRKYCWDPKDKIFRDYNFVKDEQTQSESIAMVYPLYIGMTNKEETFGVAQALRDRYLKVGGFVTTLVETGEQWDGDNVWAPPNWAATRGLARMAHVLLEQGIEAAEVEELFELAERGRAGYMHAVETAHRLFGMLPEKMNGKNPTQLAGGGEYALVKVLNMTIETYNAMKAWSPRETGGCLPIGRLALGRS
ncbi:MAG TPA: trehalase family glycosidase, partial [Candidatus Saccharimonadales bacterium]|nr:trehalase family glycosidase [Candidatus Saccharimonadales bacterium]